MTSPTVRRAAPPKLSSSGGPCGDLRLDSDRRCADAERLTRSAQEQQLKLRAARLEQTRVMQQVDANARLRDRRQLTEAKMEAQRAYHEALGRAAGKEAVQAAVADWLRGVDHLNREARLADRRADELGRLSAELSQTLPQLELAADAARIAADAAQVACLEARRAVAACEEDARRGVVAAPRAAIQSAPMLALPVSLASAPPGPSGTGPSPPDPTLPPIRPNAPVHEFLRGDRQVMLGLALRLGEETGLEAGRLQLMLLELRDGIAARALESFAFAYPQGHPFWSQFTNGGAHRVAEALGSMGYRFDGSTSWADGRAPGIRDLALALSYSGYDPRTLRRPASQPEIDALWHGTTVRVTDWALSQAPTLDLPAVVACLGPHATRLGELWDVWGRLRPLLAG